MTDISVSTQCVALTNTTRDSPLVVDDGDALVKRLETEFQFLVSRQGRSRENKKCFCPLRSYKRLLNEKVVKFYADF